MTITAYEHFSVEVGLFSLKIDKPSPYTLVMVAMTLAFLAVILYLHKRYKQ